jgi:hypothetical protein
VNREQAACRRPSYSRVKQKYLFLSLVFVYWEVCYSFS